MSVTISSPSSGHVCVFDETVNIQWTWTGSGAPDRYRVQMSWDGGRSYVDLATSVTGTSYAWKVAGLASNIARLKVISLGTSSEAEIPITVVPSGLQGPPGKDGKDGATGATGPKGPPGPTGDPRELGIAVVDPIISCAPAGEHVPAHHLRASTHPDQGAVHAVDMSGVMPAGARLVGGWYSPKHNVPALEHFALIRVGKRSDTELEVEVGTWPNKRGDLRIQLFGLWVK